MATLSSNRPVQSLEAPFTRRAIVNGANYPVVPSQPGSTSISTQQFYGVPILVDFIKYASPPTLISNLVITYTLDQGPGELMPGGIAGMVVDMTANVGVPNQGCDCSVRFPDTGFSFYVPNNYMVQMPVYTGVLTFTVIFECRRSDVNPPILTNEAPRFIMPLNFRPEPNLQIRYPQPLT